MLIAPFGSFQFFFRSENVAAFDSNFFFFFFCTTNPRKHKQTRSFHTASWTMLSDLIEHLNMIQYKNCRKTK